MQVPYKQSQSQTDVFMALINQSNPGLSVHPLQLTDLRSLAPTVIASPVGIQDTSIRLLVKPSNANYYGSQTVTYRRIKLSQVYKGLPTNGGVPTLALLQYSSSSLTVAQIIAEVNQRLGTAFVLADIANAGPLVSGSTMTLVMNATSLCYQAEGAGSINVTWTRPKQPLQASPGGAITTIPTVLNGRSYPGGNTFPRTTPQGDFFTYGADFSQVSTQLNALAATGTITAAMLQTGGSWNTIVGLMQARRPSLNFNASDAGSVSGGLLNCTWARFTIPSASVPGANAVKFTSVVVVRPPVSGTPWFQGQIYLHYTPGSGTSTVEGFYLNSNDELQQLMIAAGATNIGQNTATTGWTVTGIRATKTADNQPNQNTKLRVTPQPGNTFYSSFADLFYNRMDLQFLASFNPYVLSMAPGISVLTVLNTIRDQFGIQLTTDDINDATTVDKFGDGSATSVTLVAKSTSLSWFGTVTLTFGGLPDISTAFVSPVLTGF
jgi:hypothetical protein